MNGRFLLSLSTIVFLTAAAAQPSMANPDRAIRLGASEDDTERPEPAGRVWLGVHVQALDEALREAFDLQGSGVLVNRVVDDSPAAAAGLRVGDIITEVDGRSVEDVGELRRRLADSGVGEVEITYLRRGRSASVRAELREAHGRPHARRHRGGTRVERLHLGGSFLGVRLAALEGELATYFDVEPDGGALVLSVVEDSPAAKAGVKAGDVIKAVGDDQVSSPGELTRAVRALEPGSDVELEIVRRGRERTLKVTLGESPLRGMRRHVILRPEDLHQRLDLDPEHLERLHEGLMRLPEAEQEMRGRLERVEELLESLREEIDTLKQDRRR